MIDQVITRIEAQVPDLAKRVEGAAKWGELLQNNRLPQHDPAVYVLSLGLLGGQVQSTTGAFIQDFAQSIGVVLIFQGRDRTGKRALDRLNPFIIEVIQAIAGGQPSDEVGVFKLTRGGLINTAHGRLAYQLDFAITDQLRIYP